MWFMNHIFNSIVRWILSSPFHGMMSNEVLLISFKGRKSGKHYTTPVQYIQVGQEIWIMVGFPGKKQWWMNLVENVPVNLCLHGEWQSGQAAALTGEKDRSEIIRGLDAFVNKYPGLGKKYSDRAQAEFDLSGIVLVKVLLD
ncbi:MAG: nitroreductase family deazaflavin-dependent oxidoreductase [Anaerolineaceae bacterium]